jgi:hypothetical protein
MITPVDGEAEMPRGRKPLTEAEQNLIAEWIRQGAKDDSSHLGPASGRNQKRIGFSPVSICV